MQVPADVYARSPRVYRGLDDLTYLDHKWSSTWASAVGYSRVDVTNSDLQAPNAFRIGQYGSGNLIFTPVENLTMGGELQWTRRENFSDGFSVNDVRLQVSFRYTFSYKLGG